jgi:hypothetical protein
MAVKWLANDFVLTSNLMSQYSRSIADLRGALLERIEKAALVTDCCLKEQILAITAPGHPPTEDSLAAQIRCVKEAIESVQALKHLHERVLRNCLCAALNPKCPDCDDTGVLLACLTVQDCRVKEICLMEREFVFAPTALAYWLPLRLLGEIVEKMCCDPCEAGYVGKYFASLTEKGAEAPREILSSIMRPFLSVVLSAEHLDRLSETLASISGLLQKAATQETPQDAAAAATSDTQVLAAEPADSSARDVQALRRRLAALEKKVAQMSGGSNE